MLLFAPLVCFALGLVVGYLRGLQQSRVGRRSSLLMLVVLIVPAASQYAANHTEMLSEFTTRVLAAYLMLMLGIVIGGIMRKRLGRSKA